MNESTQQSEQPTEAPLDSTVPTQEVEGTGEIQGNVNEPDTNADTETDSLGQHLATFDAMHGASQEAPADNTQPQQQPSQPEAGSPAESAAPTQPTPVDNSRPDTRMDQMWNQFEADSRRKATQDVDNAVDTVKQSSPVLQSLPDYLIKGGLEELHRRDPRIGKAFALRHEDPKLWNETVAELGKHMAKDFGTRPDTEASEGVAAIRASVNSQSGGDVSTGPSDEEIADMTDGQFEQYKRSRFN